MFILLGIFALLSTVMVMMGAKIYRGTVDSLSAHNNARVAPAYVRSMVRAQDERGTVSTEEVGGIPAITMTAEYDGDRYTTRIYAYDGQLREWFSDAEMEFLPEDGEAVCDCDEMTCEIEGGVLRVRLREDDSWTEADIALRSVG